MSKPSVHSGGTELFDIQGVQEFFASILYLVVLCQFLISDAWQDSFEKPRARSRAQRGRFLNKSQK
jgi:hypothetical protein